MELGTLAAAALPALIQGGSSVLSSWLSSKNKKKDATTTVYEDPYKTAVSNPLSSYLASQVGKGLPEYPGQITTGLDTQGENAYTDLLSMNAGDWYTKAVQEPTMEAMREEIPVIEEGYAGSLRGSGRYRDVEDYMADTAETLSTGRYKAELEINQAKYQSAETYAAARNEENKTKYMAWLNTLPQYNPAFAQMVSFLGADSGWNLVVT